METTMLQGITVVALAFTIMLLLSDLWTKL